MKKLKKTVCSVGIGAVVFASMALPAFANTVTNPSSNDCLGVERSVRNSNGGDREHGGFGPVQSEFVKQNQPYGQWLQGWKDANCS